MRLSRLAVPAALAALTLAAPARRAGAAAVSWPGLESPAPSVGGGESDAAVVVGIERYAFVSKIAGAGDNARSWYDYLTKTRGIKPSNVRLLMESDGTLEEIRDAAKQAAASAAEGGTLWFVFIGHGAPGRDGKDGVLVGVDAQQKAASLYSRSLQRQDLLRALGETKAAQVNVVLDACFSGQTERGALVEGLQPLVAVAMAPVADSRFLVMTAAKGNQFAGPLPGSRRPAFSYLMLGALRGWGDADKDGKVTAGEAFGFTEEALRATLRGREQSPELTGKGNVVIGASAGEAGPDIAAMAKQAAGRPAAEMFQISELPTVPMVEAPQALDLEGDSADWRDLDVDALERYDAALAFDKGEASAEEKMARWTQLAQSSPQFADKASRRAEEWKRFAEQKKAAEEARQRRAEARDKDWTKLSRLLQLKVIPEKDKKRWALLFVQAYGKTSQDNPYLRDLAALLPPGTVKAEDMPSAAAAAAGGSAGRYGVVWVTIPGGEFMMGSNSGDPDEKPVHSVRIRTFQMSRTEATWGQYRQCVRAGACEAITEQTSCTVFGAAKLPEFVNAADNVPVVCVSPAQARRFAAWAGGRLPSEAEWEYAARGGGQDRKWPWGDDSSDSNAFCERAVSDVLGDGCGRNVPWPVCSKPLGNTVHGLCDMAGNVREYVEDDYHDSYSGAPTDGSAWGSGAAYSTVLRGGTWRYGTADSRTTNRESGSGDSRHGFRIAR